MPLTRKGQKILEQMKREYGDEEGERVFYALKNSGKISGVEKKTTGLRRRGNPA